jgi:acyl carrier protein
METLEILNGIFRQVFDDNSLSVTREITANDIEEWDSLTHINLVIAIEMHFGIKFGLGEMKSLRNVGEMVDLITKKCLKSR